MSHWFNIKAAVGDRAEIEIYDSIGKGGVSADAFRDRLKAVGSVSHLLLSINSPGGDVFSGNAIFAMLERHPAHITVRIDGVAASAASLIAMAGDKILMPSNAMMMLHEPSARAEGGAQAVRRTAELLDRVTAAMVATYSKRSRQPESVVAELMKRETWLTAGEAVRLGFADEVEQPVKLAAMHDLSMYEHPPAPGGFERPFVPPPAEPRLFLSNTAEVFDIFNGKRTD